MIRLIYMVPSWILFFFFRLTLMLLGYILVPIACAFKAYEMTDLNVDKPADGPIYHFTWRFMFIWDNWEDGIANRNYKRFSSMAAQILYWSCVRNPANNLRITPYLSCMIDPKQIKFIGDDERFLCWHGFYSCLHWKFNTKTLLIGWKVYPQDRFGVTSHRRMGAGFTSRYRS